MPNNVPQRPHASYLARSTDHLAPDAQRPFRPSRLVTDPGVGQRPPMPRPLQVPSTPPPDGDGSPSMELRSLMPGTLLRSGRYRLREMQERQEWLAGVFEAVWIAQDAQRSGAQVMLCELATPETGSMVMQSMLRTATMALTSVGRHPHIPTLWDAFSDQGRSFFVFEPADGESLLVRMRRTGRALPEQDVIECCLQITEVLELLSQQSPPLVHGLIRPEHIVAGRVGSYYMLTNFSIVLAGGATQFITGMERSYLSPYTAPEFTRGMTDARSDLYSLVATAYHVVTGSMPTAVNGNIPQAQRLNPNVSSQFDAILAKGLRPLANQRYQRPSELRQDLLMMRAVSGSLSPRGEQRPEQLVPLHTTPAPDPVAQMLPNMLASTVDDIDDQERKLLLPRPEELPPMRERNDTRYAAFWLGGILLCLIIVVLLSRGLM